MKKHSKRYQELMQRVYPEEGLIFTDEEIIFLCKEDLVGFADKWPGIAEYYMQVLSD
jgi:hypothetical protein